MEAPGVEFFENPQKIGAYHTSDVPTRSEHRTPSTTAHYTHLDRVRSHAVGFEHAGDSVA